MHKPTLMQFRFSLIRERGIESTGCIKCRELPD